jgi:HEAT repeat protein
VLKDAPLADYTEAVSIEERTSALAVIGNGGDASLLPLVANALSDKNPRVQEAAAFALRFMGAAADPPLGRALGSPFPEVRMAAVRAIQLRPVDALRSALENALAVERDAKLSRAIQRLLARAA